MRAVSGRRDGIRVPDDGCTVVERDGEDRSTLIVMTTDPQTGSIGHSASFDEDYEMAEADQIDVTPEIDEIAELQRAAKRQPSADDPDAPWRHGYPYDKKMTRRTYERQKRRLQIELLKLQAWVKESGQKIVIVFEGRDAAGKGGSIKRFTEHLNPRGARCNISSCTEAPMGRPTMS